MPPQQSYAARQPPGKEGEKPVTVLVTGFGVSMNFPWCLDLQHLRLSICPSASRYRSMPVVHLTLRITITRLFVSRLYTFSPRSSCPSLRLLQCKLSNQTSPSLRSSPKTLLGKSPQHSHPSSRPHPPTKPQSTSTSITNLSA
jgi:hypothetical protein